MEYRTKLMLQTVPQTEQPAVISLLEEKGFVACILHLWRAVWGPNQKEKIKECIKIHDSSNVYYKLIFEEFNIRRHFQIVDSHKRWVVRSYERLAKFVPNVTKEQIDEHDESKYSMEQSFGYTAKWVHGVDWSNLEWQEALNDHYQKENHHPEHYANCPMSQSALEESIVDMMACRWERQLGGRDDVTNEELLDIKGPFLDRYCQEDQEIVKGIIQQMKEGGASE